MKKNTLILSFLFLVLLGHAQQIKVTEPEYNGNIVFVNDTIGVGLKLEQQSPSIKISGYLKYTWKYELKGCCSNFIIDNKPNLQFIVKSTNNSSDPALVFAIYKLKKGKSNRVAVTAKMGLGGTTAVDDGIISFNGKKYGQSSYILEIPSLEAGEYGILRLPDGTLNSPPAVFYLFAVK